MRALLLLLSFAFLFPLSACVTTKTTGYVDPAYSSGVFQIKKVVVRANGGGLEETDLAETGIVQKLSDLGVEAIRYIDIVPPTRTYSVEEALKIVDDTGADSLLIVSIEDVSTKKSYVPPTYHAGTTHSTINAIGNTAYVNTYSSPGYTTGGYTVSKPTMATSSVLVDMSNGNNIWKADGYSGGNSISSYADLLVSAGKSAITDLQSKGLIGSND